MYDYCYYKCICVSSVLQLCHISCVVVETTINQYKTTKLNTPCTCANVSTLTVLYFYEMLTFAHHNTSVSGEIALQT